MSILITGGAGFIGSHTAVEFLNAGYDIVIVDNYCNSSPRAIERIKEITGKDFRTYEVDLCDKVALEQVFVENPEITSAIHFAGLKAVGESVAKPGLYYYNNLLSTLNLVDLMSKYNAKNIVFSSSATVYGSPKTVPIREDFELSTTNPYGETKLMIERILKDVWVADHEWSVSILRYFNPIGAHKSGLIGENPKGIPNNLLPYVAKVAAGQLPYLSVFGNDYPTPDGTGVRDYIHVVDLAKAHLKALERAEKINEVEYFNVGTGTGYSVLDIVKAYEKATGLKVNYKITDRRPGDIATCYADPTKAYEVLGWKAENDIDDMCRDLANWMKKNPNGYEGE
ncbi:MAG: UDP-glucose 4-epimerase GalE [Clostridia bacterium]|nr:UDP-glucose 4-epimerase GalE [Clostridia bacterium]